MLRICKLTDTALEQTLRLFLDPETLAERHPTFRMLTAPLDDLREKAENMKRRLNGMLTSLVVRVTPGESETGGGSMPGTPIPTFALAVTSDTRPPDRVSFLLRQCEPPVVARIAGDAVMLDMRTLLDGEDDIVIDALRAIDGM